MKSVLISIRPKWCELIASGKKTIEVRKTRPKIETPFKCYIYATKATKWFHSGSILTSDELLWLSNGKIKMCDGFELWADGEDYQCVNGKVIGEFVCDKISEIWFSPWSHCEYVSDIENLYKASCLNFDEMFSYLGEDGGYGWHISDLKIYGKPRELSEFGRGCDAENISEIHCRDCRKLVSFDERCEVMCKPLNRPPQSYMFVEEVKK